MTYLHLHLSAICYYTRTHWNTYVKALFQQLYFSSAYTRSAKRKLHTQPEGRLHTGLSSQLLIYIIKLRDSQLHFPAIIRVVTRKTGAGNEAMVGPSGQKWDRREKPAGEKGLHWEKVWRRCSAGLASAMLCNFHTTACSYLASSSGFTTPQKS